MNVKQKIVLIVVAAIIFMMFLFPPFVIKIQSTSMNFGYSFILSPPKYGGLLASVNIGQLFLQWLAIVSIGLVGWLILKKSK